MTAESLPPPKASVFDGTHPGTEPWPASPGLWGWFRRRSALPPTEVPEPMAPEALRERLRKPARAVALPTLPDPDPALARLLEEVLAEATGLPPEAPRPVEAVEAATRPVILPAPPIAPDATTRRLPDSRPRGRRAWAAAAGLALAGAASLGLWALLGRNAIPEGPALPPEVAALKVRADQGDVAAMRLLGLRYAYGLQVPADSVEAARWLDKAALAGSLSARQERAALRKAP